MGEVAGFKVPPVSTAPSAPAAVNVGVLEECQICLDGTYEEEPAGADLLKAPNASISNEKACGMLTTLGSNKALFVTRPNYGESRKSLYMACSAFISNSPC